MRSIAILAITPKIKIYQREGASTTLAQATQNVAIHSDGTGEKNIAAIRDEKGYVASILALITKDGQKVYTYGLEMAAASHFR